MELVCGGGEGLGNPQTFRIQSSLEKKYRFMEKEGIALFLRSLLATCQKLPLAQPGAHSLQQGWEGFQEGDSAAPLESTDSSRQHSFMSLLTL